jgi:tetratricopeptide (TPR) repeat protein
MLTIKNQAGMDVRKWFCFASVLFCALMLTGCTPEGPRALLAGKRLMDQGKYPQAVEKLRTATSLLVTNAQAWNYLGLACQQAGEAAEAEKAYQRALALDHDLTEAHYNLGCLWLAQNKPDAARTELMAFTLRRANSAEGLLQLGAAQLRVAEIEPTIQARSRELIAAEKSFADALRLNPRSAEGLNGVGLVRLQRGRASEAAHFFNSALALQPDYGPALLNLAVVSQQYLKDRHLAVQKYREYLALKPRPENADAVNAVVLQLEQELAPKARTAAASVASQNNTNLNLQKPLFTNAARIAAVAKTDGPSNAIRLTPPATLSKPAVGPSPPKSVPSPIPTTAVEVVNVPADAKFKVAQDVSTPPSPVQTPLSQSGSSPSSTESRLAERGLLQRVNPLSLFHGEQKLAPRSAPLAGASDSAQAEAQSPGSTARYPYQSLSRPALGNRAQAERLFSQGVQAQQTHRLAEAIQAYTRATQLDPGYFEAYYNLGLAATEAGNPESALRAYETGLAVRPESLDARYNFALALKQASYFIDAAHELEKLLAAYPNETRAHLTLGNIYAQQLRQEAKARQHYSKVLEADPRNAQAGAIRYWLIDNP